MKFKECQWINDSVDVIIDNEGRYKEIASARLQK